MFSSSKNTIEAMSVMPGLTSRIRFSASEYMRHSRKQFGRGPTRLMSPARTLRSWGNSSSLKRRMTCPTRVMRGSLAGVASTPLCSALGTIERILNWRYGFQPLPTRGPAKKGACRSSSQTASANGKPTRIAKGNNVAATVMSSNRLFLGPIRRPCANPDIAPVSAIHNGVSRGRDRGRLRREFAALLGRFRLCLRNDLTTAMENKREPRERKFLAPTTGPILLRQCPLPRRRFRAIGEGAPCVVRKSWWKVQRRGALEHLLAFCVLFELTVHLSEIIQDLRVILPLRGGLL